MPKVPIAISILAPLCVAAAPTTNPVEIDRQVFAQLGQPKDLITQANDLDQIPLDAKAAAYIEQRRPLLEQLMQAATLPQADWGEPVSINQPLNDLNHARITVQMTWLAARLDEKNDHPAQAVDELLAGVALARHIGQQKLLASHLVECSCEAGSIDRLAAMLPSLPPDVVKTLPAKWDALPPSAGLAAVLDGERAYGAKQIALQFPTTSPASTQPGSPATQASNLDSFYDALKAAANQSPDDFVRSVNQAVATSHSAFAPILGPSIARARIPSAVVEAKRVMLRTAIAIAIKGPDELNQSRDPFGNGAFARDEATGGYTLSSQLKNHGKPISLRVGR